MKYTGNTDQTPTNFAATITGTFDGGDLTSVTLQRNTTPDLTGSPVTVATQTATADSAPHTYNFANATALGTGVKYFILTAAIAAGADTGHTLQASKLTLTGGGTKTDSQTTPAGLKTITA